MRKPMSGYCCIYAVQSPTGHPRPSNTLQKQIQTPSLRIRILPTDQNAHTNATHALTAETKLSFLLAFYRRAM